MTHILFITSSARGDASDSNRVSARALDEIRRYRRDAAVVVRDLAHDALHHICHADRTFSYGEERAKGLVSGKQVIVVVARGGINSDANKAADFQLPYPRNVLAFLGMTEAEVVEVEGTAFGPEAADKSVASAFRQLYERCSQAVVA